MSKDRQTDSNDSHLATMEGNHQSTSDCHNSTMMVLQLLRQTLELVKVVTTGLDHPELYLELCCPEIRVFLFHPPARTRDQA